MKMTGMTGVRSFSFASAMTPVWVSQRAPVGTMELRVWVPQGRQTPLFGVLTVKKGGTVGREAWPPTSPLFSETGQVPGPESAKHGGVWTEDSEVTRMP